MWFDAFLTLHHFQTFILPYNIIMISALRMRILRLDFISLSYFISWFCIRSDTKISPGHFAQGIQRAKIKCNIANQVFQCFEFCSQNALISVVLKSSLGVTGLNFFPIMHMGKQTNKSSLDCLCEFREHYYFPKYKTWVFSEPYLCLIYLDFSVKNQ